MDIKALKNGDIAFGAFDPAFGRFSKNGDKTLYRATDIADFRGAFEDDFLLSHNANVIEFTLEYRGKRPARFSLDERVLVENPPHSPFNKGGSEENPPL